MGCTGVEVFPHRFRHHFSRTWLDRGGAEGDLMELNGWPSPQMLRQAKGGPTRPSRTATGNFTRPARGAAIPSAPATCAASSRSRTSTPPGSSAAPAARTGRSAPSSPRYRPIPQTSIVGRRGLGDPVGKTWAVFWDCLPDREGSPRVGGSRKAAPRAPAGTSRSRRRQARSSGVPETGLRRAGLAGCLRHREAGRQAGAGHEVRPGPAGGDRRAGRRRGCRRGRRRRAIARRGSLPRAGTPRPAGPAARPGSPRRCAPRPG
jgi:hypothetical protein